VKILVDTGGVLNALDSDSPEHQAFYDVLTRARVAWITPITVAEVHYLLTSRRNYRTADAFLQDVASGFYELVNPTANDYEAARDLIAKYSGRIERKKAKAGSIDLARAINAVAAAKVDTNRILTTDADYRIIRPLSRHPAFTILPADQARQG
jgi:predicted nucleic acid-binding protein